VEPHVTSSRPIDYLKPFLGFLAAYVATQLLDEIKAVLAGMFMLTPITSLRTTTFGVIGLLVIVLSLFLFVQSAWTFFGRKPFKGMKLDSKLDQLEARLFFPWYYFVPLFSRSLGFSKDLNHIPRVKLLIDKKRQLAFHMLDWAQGLLTPTQRIQWQSERKSLFGFDLKSWAESRGYKYVPQGVSESDIIHTCATDVQWSHSSQIIDDATAAGDLGRLNQLLDVYSPISALIVAINNQIPRTSDEKRSSAIVSYELFEEVNKVLSRNVSVIGASEVAYWSSHPYIESRKNPPETVEIWVDRRMREWLDTLDARYQRVLEAKRNFSRKP
jgi:hypothetical protein